MTVTQQIFLAVVVVGFISLQMALLYGWGVTKGWEQRAPPVTKTAPKIAIDHPEGLAKAA